MRDTKIAHRYAMALFRVALKSDTLDFTAIDLNQLRSFASAHKDFLGFLKSPSIRDDDKMNLLRTLFTTRLSPQVLSFLELLLHKHRIDLFPEIVAEFDRIVEEHYGLIRAKVVSAVHLGEDVKNALKVKLEKISGKKIEIIHKIDRSIIGGMIIYLHNQVIDRSIRHQLDQLRHDLLSVKVH